MTNRKRMVSGHWNDCGIYWDWGCDCGYARERNEALQPFRDLLEKAEDAVERLLDRIVDWREKKR